MAYSTDAAAAPAGSASSKLAATAAAQAPTRTVAAASIPPPLDLRSPDLKGILALTLPGDASLEEDVSGDRDVDVVASPLEPETRTQVTLAGIGSLYWAARNPSQALRVLLPVLPANRSSQPADIKVNCAVYIFARAPSERLFCP